MPKCIEADGLSYSNLINSINPITQSTKGWIVWIFLFFYFKFSGVHWGSFTFLEDKVVVQAGIDV